MEVHMLWFSSEHPKWDQSPKFTSLTETADKHPHQVPPAPSPGNPIRYVAVIELAR